MCVYVFVRAKAGAVEAQFGRHNGQYDLMAMIMNKVALAGWSTASQAFVVLSGGGHNRGKFAGKRAVATSGSFLGAIPVALTGLLHRQAGWKCRKPSSHLMRAAQVASERASERPM